METEATCVWCYEKFAAHRRDQIRCPNDRRCEAEQQAKERELLDLAIPLRSRNNDQCGLMECNEPLVSATKVVIVARHPSLSYVVYTAMHSHCKSRFLMRKSRGEKLIVRYTADHGYSAASK